MLLLALLRSVGVTMLADLPPAEAVLAGWETARVRLMTVTFTSPRALRSTHLPAQPELRILVLFARFADLKLIVTDPAFTTIGIYRTLDPGDRKQVRPERVGPVDILTYMPRRITLDNGDHRGRER